MFAATMNVNTTGTFAAQPQSTIDGTFIDNENTTTTTSTGLVTVQGVGVFNSTGVNSATNMRFNVVTFTAGTLLFLP